MRRYEQIYILRPSLSEDQITTVIENTTTLITADEGTIINLDKWGMRKLAYPIKKEAQGYYVFCDFTATPATVSEIERKFRIDDTVLKYLTVKLTDDISAEMIEQAKADAAAAAQPETAEEQNSGAETTETAGEEETSAPAPAE